jgi:uncharacterized protein YndB with AHSA1/START domain
VPRTRRSRTFPVAVDELWRTVGDPHHLPRWWPRVARVENVDEGAFTEVLKTDKGRSVRADFRVEASEPPTRRRWSQQVENTPFERILKTSCTEVRLEPAGTGTKVVLELDQSLRGLALFGGFMVRRAARRQLDEALDGLQGLAGG